MNEQDEGSMEEFVAYLVGDLGYSRNECPCRCPHKAVEHAHLHSPGNPASIGIPPGDFILWEDGTSSRLDPTRRADCTSEVTGGVMSEAGGGLTYPDSAGDETCDGTVVAYVIAASPSAPFPGWYLKNVGSVDAHWTPEPGEAMRFPSSAAAMTFWNSVPPGLGAYFPVQVELATE